MELAAERGDSRLAVTGSLARGRATRDSDIDLLVDAPRGRPRSTSSGSGGWKDVGDVAADLGVPRSYRALRGADEFHDR